MKKNKDHKKGFTLIEVLISIVILSLIAVITSNFLKSSIQSRDLVSGKSQDIYEFNLLTSTLTNDLINAVNIPLINFRGDREKATFIGGANTDSFSFITKAITQDISSKDLVRSCICFRKSIIVEKAILCCLASKSLGIYGN